MSQNSNIKAALEKAFGVGMPLVSFSPDTATSDGDKQPFSLTGHLSDEGITMFIDEFQNFGETEKTAYLDHFLHCRDCGERFVKKTDELSPP